MLAVLLLCFVMPARPSSSESPGMSVSVPGGEISPGRPVIIDLQVPRDGACTIGVTDGDGMEIGIIAADRPVTAGHNSLYWNGTCDGIPVQPGDWIIFARMDELAAETAVSVGNMIPCLIAVQLESDTVEEGDTVLLSYYATASGALILQQAGEKEPLYWDNVTAGEGEVSFQAEMEPGTYEMSLTLVDELGTVSEPAAVRLNVLEKPDPNAVPTPEPLPDYLREKAENGFTPAHTSAKRGEDPTLNYWTLPMDITDEEAVWKVLTAPMTILDNGKKNAERTQVIIRSSPSDSSDGVGVVTCISQGVHVLERGEEWSLIECYSSSFHDSPILNWNALVQGYVPTSMLREIMPNQEMGLVVDKLTQRLYVFREGKLFSTLLVSTGIANAKQPYNETRSGEFLLISKVGEFASDNLRCALALRFNDGDLLHEVPYIAGENGRDYSVNEPKLGKKASHGCIRVQRQATPEGVNQKWLWNNYKKNTRIMIWEDWQGRQIPLPSADTVLWCLKRKTGYYHTSEKCGALRGKRTVSITYGELEKEENLKLKACPLCAAPGRAEAIEEANRTYAEGGDHDPILTEARKNCPRKLKGK